MRASPLMRRILAVVNARAAERELQIVNSDDLTDSALGPPEEERLEERRLRLQHGLTNMQRLFLFGKLSGLNDKDAALAAGYSLSVAENTRQKIWKPRLVEEFSQVKSRLSPPIPSRVSREK
jgi:hypothetical protein